MAHFNTAAVMTVGIGQILDILEMYRQQINLTGNIGEEKSINDYLKFFFTRRIRNIKFSLSEEGKFMHNGKIKFREIIKFLKQVYSL